MTVVSTKEFNTNQKRYFELAENEEVCIKRGNSMYRLMYRPLEIQYPEQPILEPDDDFYRAISADEFRKRLIVVLDRVDKKYANKCK